MSNYLPGLLVMIAVAVIALALMLWGWRRRSRRDAGLIAPTAALVGAEKVSAEGLYVATTAHDSSLERLAIRGLAFRSRVTVTVLESGVRLVMPGEPIVSIPASSLVSVDRASVTIDRVVEKDGMVRIAWLISDDTIVDSYLRLQETDPTHLIAAIASLVSAPSSTGTDA